MRYIFVIFALWCCSISCWAQTDSTQVRKPLYSVRHDFISDDQLKEMAELEAFRQRHLFLAGEAIRREVGFVATSAATSVVSGILFGLAGQAEEKAPRIAMYAMGGLTAGISLFCTAYSIHYRLKAGRELRLSAGEVIYRF